MQKFHKINVIVGFSVFNMLYLVAVLVPLDPLWIHTSELHQLDNPPGLVKSMSN